MKLSMTVLFKRSSQNKTEKKKINKEPVELAYRPFASKKTLMAFTGQTFTQSSQATHFS